MANCENFANYANYEMQQCMSKGTRYLREPHESV